MLDIEKDFCDIIKYVDTPKPKRIITNYDRLRKCGFNGKTRIYDTTPMTFTKMNFGEYMNIFPIGLTKAQLQKYFENRRNKIAELCEIQHDQNQRVKKAKQKKRIKDFIAGFKSPMFCTITFSDDVMKTDYNRKIKAIMSKLNVDYCLVSDYGEETCRLHYHGFIDINDLLSDFNRFNEYFYIDLNHKTKQKKDIYHCTLFDSVGWNSFVIQASNNDLEKSLNYCVKYMTKEMEQDKTHRILRSRTKSQGNAC